MGQTNVSEYHGLVQITVEPWHNKPLYNEVRGITTIFLTPVIIKCMQKNLDVKKPRYREQILPVSWPFYIWRFHYNAHLYFLINYVTRGREFHHKQRETFV